MITNLLLSALLLSSHVIADGVSIRYYKGRSCNKKKVYQYDDVTCKSLGNIFDMSCNKDVVFFETCAGEGIIGTTPTGCIDFCGLLEQYDPTLISDNMPFCSFKYTCDKPSKVPIPEIDDSCDTPTGACDFYPTCLAKAFPCRSNEYALGYGYQSCRNSKSYQVNFSEKGTQYVDGYNLCLQEKLSKLFTKSEMSSNSCSDVQDYAFKAQYECLKNPTKELSMCDLTQKDMSFLTYSSIMATVASSSTSESLRQVWDTAKLHWETCSTENEGLITQIRIKFKSTPASLSTNYFVVADKIIELIKEYPIFSTYAVYLVAKRLDGIFYFIPSASEKRSEFNFENFPHSEVVKMILNKNAAADPETIQRNLEMIQSNLPVFKMNGEKVPIPDISSSLDRKRDSIELEYELGVSLLLQEKTLQASVDDLIKKIETLMEEQTSVTYDSLRTCKNECENPNSSSSFSGPLIFVTILSLVLTLFTLF